MEIVREGETQIVSLASSAQVREFAMSDEDINGAVAEVNGRYPVKGQVVNDRSKEMVYILAGEGVIVVEGKEFGFEAGDLLLIAPGERYFWQGEFRLFIANTPKWREDQHRLVS